MKNIIKQYLNNYPKIYAIFRKLYIYTSEVRRKIRIGFSIIFRIFPVKENKIVICNYFGKGYGDNGKYIVEEIIRQGLNYDIVWLLKRDLVSRSEFPPQVRIVKYGSIKGLFELATAKIWIDNCRKTFYPLKRNNQYYIQTWHGGIALKRIEKDAESKLDISYIKNAKRDSNMADLFISNSTFCTEMYRSAFWYDGEIEECGTPRCDALINKNNNTDKVRRYFNIDNNIKILIYAPTFRTDSCMEVYDINFKELINVLEMRFGKKWVVIIRLHPNISDKANFFEYTTQIKNATNYDDMYELLKASDILITDYSSTMFEFSFMHKPVFLYAPDIVEYIEERNFYFDINTLPYPLAQNNRQLMDAIKYFNNTTYIKQLNNLFSNLHIVECGNASKKVVEIIKNFD